MGIMDAVTPDKGIAGKAMERLFGGEDTEEKLNTLETKEKLQANTERRHGFLGEFFESFIARKFPTISRLLDLGSAIGLKDKDPELYSLQNEFEALTALSTFIPNSLLSKFTDPLLRQSWFITIVKLYPFDAGIQKKILENKDPQAVIDFLRMVHQDIVAVVSGKKSLGDIFGKK